MNGIGALRPFVEPRSVALIGVSRKTGKEAFNVLENLMSYGYRGQIYPVNPNTGEILGVKAYPNVAEVPGEIDLAVIMTPRDVVLPVVKECIDNHIRSLVVVAQGFADADIEGKKLQEELVRLARSGGARIIGPNTFGTANAYINFSSSLARIEMAEIPVGLACQSGVFFVGSPSLKLVGKGIDLGNSCDLGFAECLQFFTADPKVKVIVLHIEGVNNGRDFLDAAREATQEKPVLVLKTGRTGPAALAAASHTGSLTGKDEVWEASMNMCGILRVKDTEEMADLVKAFSNLPPMRGKKVAVMTFTGGFGIIAVDACGEYNLDLARLSSQTALDIAGMSPQWLNIRNPVDIWPAVGTKGELRGIAEAMRKAFRSLLSDTNVDALLFIAGAFFHEYASALSELILESARAFPNKPFVSYLYGPCAQEVADEVHSVGGAVVFPSVERAIRALSALHRYETAKTQLASQDARRFI